MKCECCGVEFNPIIDTVYCYDCCTTGKIFSKLPHKTKQQIQTISDHKNNKQYECKECKKSIDYNTLAGYCSDCFAKPFVNSTTNIHEKVETAKEKNKYLTPDESIQILQNKLNILESRMSEIERIINTKIFGLGYKKEPDITEHNDY